MQWHKTKEGEERLTMERELLRLDFPDVNIIMDNDGTLYIYGRIGSGRALKKEYRIIGMIPNNYPQSRISIYLPDEHFLTGTPHLYSDGELDLPGMFEEDDTMSTVVERTVVWIVFYENFVEKGERF